MRRRRWPARSRWPRGRGSRAHRRARCTSTCSPPATASWPGCRVARVRTASYALGVPRALPELDAIERLATTAPSAEVLATVDGLPIHAFAFGATDRRVPTLLITGGVHGLERIGTEVAIAYLTTLVARLAWDTVLHAALAQCRVLVVPLINPAGRSRGLRPNGNGVDLMRNAPAAPLGGTPLLGGQQISPRLPWYMGAPGAPMEPEAAALVAFVERELFATPFAIALDLHS